MARFHILLCIVPQTARVGHEQRQKQTAYNVAQQEAANGQRSTHEAHHHRGHDGRKPGGNQLHQRAGGGDVDAAVIFRFRARVALAQAGNAAELPVDFRHHTLGIFVHAQHQHGREYRGDGSADEHAEKYRGVHNIKTGDDRFSRRHQGLVDLAEIRAQQGNDRQSRRADGKSLGHGFDGVAGAVQLIRHADGLLTQAAHLRQPAGVVHDGAVGVVGDDHAHDGQHAHRRHGDAEHGIITPQRRAEAVGRERRNSDADHGRQGRDKAVGHAGEHRERRPGA